MKKRIRILVVEDSILMTNVIAEMLSSDERLLVIGTARNGEEGVEKVQSLNPDVVTLDMEMPVMNGIEFLKRVMDTHPVPVVMLSAYTREGARETIEALQLGAFDFVSKPSGSISIDIRDIREELIEKIVLASGIKREILSSPPQYESCSIEYKPTCVDTRIIVLCASTGGPRALYAILTLLPENLNACILVIQHMPEEFTPMLAERLNRSSPLHVKEAEDNEVIMAGEVFVAPGGKHMEVTQEGKITLTDKPKKHGVRPSCDVTLKSLQNYGERVLSIVLTGMGKDGSEGITFVKKRKGKVIVEDESTAVIFGMPKAALKTGCVDSVIPLSNIAREIIEFSQ